MSLHLSIMKVKMCKFISPFFGGCIIVFFLFLMPIEMAYAQNSSLHTKMAKFIANFTLFTEWPQTSALNNPADTVLVATYGSEQLLVPLQNAFNGKPIKGRPTKIVAIKSIKELKAAKNLLLLYIGQAQQDDLQKVLKVTKDKPILTVGAKKEYAKKGVIINMEHNAKRKINFYINKDAVKTGGLTLKYQLYQQGKIIYTDNR